MQLFLPLALIWVCLAIGLITFLFLKGRKIISIFPNISQEDIKYIKKNSSAYSTKSLKSKISGGRKVLEVLVTSNEIWLKSSAFYAYFLHKNDVIHRIQFKNIKQVVSTENSVILDFTTENGTFKQLVINTNTPKKLIDSLAIEQSIIQSDLNQNVQTKFTPYSFSKKQKLIILPCLILLISFYVNHQYSTQKASHDSLVKHAHVALLNIQLNQKKSDVNYISFWFKTTHGKKITGYQKCGDDYNKYEKAFIIYDTTTPSNYEFSFDFTSYSPRWLIIFFFFIELPLLVIMGYNFIRIVFSLFSLVKK